MGRQTKRKRKVAVAPTNEEKENESSASTVAPNEPAAFNNGPMYKIMSHVQTSEALHKKYIKDMQQLYAKMHHDAFVHTFIHIIKSAMACDESNEYAMTSLQFCAKFIASFDSEETHPLMTSVFEWLLETISSNPHIRFRLCQFINMVLNALGAEAALDDLICDKILEYMVDRLLDCSPNVRLQAIVAMQRLQVPDNPDDPVVRAYQFHLSSDPSPRVRIAVITCLGRNVITIPYILDRLQDIDEKVRRHTYLQMSSYPVRSYKVSQRLLLMEQGLNDRCEAVRKVASKIMLQQWFESYKKDLLQLCAALKLDATEADIERFRKVTKQTLLEIFMREDPSFLVELLPLQTDLEFHRCVPFEKLQMEVALYWQCLSEYLQSQMCDEFDLILPELSVFCAYTEKFCLLQKTDMDKFEQMEFQYKLLPLLEILQKYDLGDEIGRGNLKKLLEFLLKNVGMNEKNLEIVIRCAENVIADQSERMQYLIGIVSEICQLNPTQSNLLQDRTLVNEALANCSDSVLKMKLTKLKVKILDLEEHESNLLQAKNFVEADKITMEINAVTDEFTQLLEPLLAQPLDIRKVKNEHILTGLQIIFHMIVSKKVRNLSPQDCKIYKDFICRQMASSTTAIRIWALKCGTAFSMHFETIAKEVFNTLYSQFMKNTIERIWENSVKCIFEIIDLYGIDMFERAVLEQMNSVAGTSVAASRRGGRLLYNTLENIDFDDGDQDQVQRADNEVGFIQMMSHFLDTLTNEALISEIVLGFIKLICHGHINSGEIIDKLLLRYFNPSTNTKIKQYLSIFMEEMIRLKKQTLLVPSLLPTVNSVMTAPYDSPLLEIRPETICRFFIDITRQDPTHHPGRTNNFHNKIAQAFLTEMTNNVNNRELSKLLCKELLNLELNLSNKLSLKREMKAMTDKLLTCEFDAKALKNLADFKDMLDGRFTRSANTGNESEEEADDDTVTNDNQPRTSNTTPAVDTATTTASNTTTPAPSVIAEESEATLTEETQSETTHTPAADANATADATIENSQITTVPSENLENSQTAYTSTAEAVENSQSDSQQQLPITTAEQPAPKLPTPSVTTFGSKNIIGQRCLRRSLNNSRTHSESEASDTPRIRIEVRIDSDKKKKQTTEKTKSATKSKKNAPMPAAKVINSDSSRSLRMLSRQQQKTKTPTKNQAEKTQLPTITTTTIEAITSEELNISDVIAASPQVPTNVTIHTRQRRGNTTASQSETSPSKSARAAAAQEKTPTRNSSQKTPTATPKKKDASKKCTEKTPHSDSSKTPSSKNKTPTSAVEKTPQHQTSKSKTPTSARNKTPTLAVEQTSTNAAEKTPQRQASKTITPKQKTPTSSSTDKTPVPASKKTPQQNKTLSSNADKTPQQQASKSPTKKDKTPTTQQQNTSKTRSSRGNKSTTTTPTSTESEPQSDSSSTSTTTTATKATPNRMPRKVVYKSGTATLQRSSRKRVLPKTPYPNKNKNNSESSSDRSPQPKQARRSPKNSTPGQHKRLTAQNIESLLMESDSSSITSTSSNKTKTPVKAKAAATTATKKKTPTKAADKPTAGTSSNSSITHSTRSRTKETFRQQNIMTRKRESLQGSSGSGSTTTSTQASPKKTGKKRANVGASRIPVASSQSSLATSATSSRSSSTSPLRRGRNVAVVGGFKQPAQRASSLGRPQSSRIPRKLN